MRIDLNADVGEGFAEDAAVIAVVSSVNVAGGGHAGDATTIAATVALAHRCGAAIGAHPGYPDREGFGRRELAMEAGPLQETLREQIGAVAEAAARAGTGLVHVKPHGALYNQAARDPALAAVVVSAVRSVAADLVLVGLAGSPGLRVAGEAGLRVAAEAFADRRYEPDGRLRDRRHGDALIDDPVEAAAQAVRLVRDGTVQAVDGTAVAVRADTLCIHGDAPGAAARAEAVRRALEEAGIEIRPISG